MKEHPFLALLAQLTGEFVLARNPSFEELRDFQSTVALALLQHQNPDELRKQFKFEQTGTLQTHHLDSGDLLHLNSVIEELEKRDDLKDQQIRIFRRETPFVSSQVRASLPEWARGARIERTLGPFVSNVGRRVWLDIFKVIPGVKVFLQGGTNPVMIISVIQSRIIVAADPSVVNLPEGSVWINARLLSAAAPDDEYCGLKIKSGSIRFTAPVTITPAKELIVSNGVGAAVTLNLVPQTDASVSPDNTGIDAKNAVVKLPESLVFSFSHAGAAISSISTTSWKLYEQSIGFVHAPNNAVTYNATLNRIGVPFTPSVPSFIVNKCVSAVVNLKGEATIQAAYWSLSCARMDINNPLEAAGAGALLIQTDSGLQISWLGLSDLNLEQKEWINLPAPFILAEPGRISVTDLHAGNSNARQEYILWKTGKEFNKIDLRYRSKFLFFYNCLQSGNESFMALTDCVASIDRPVDVTGGPFPLKSENTVFLLNYSQALQAVMLYDDNLLLENPPPPIPGAAIPAYFDSKAIALNNALLTVSPASGFLLYGDLSDDKNFDRAAMVCSFGLVGYLPSLPDPYAADLELYRGRGGRNDRVQPGRYPVASLRQLLAGVISWQKQEPPVVSFSFGDIPQRGTSDGPALPAANTIQFNLPANMNAAALQAENKFGRKVNYLANDYKTVSGQDEFPLSGNVLDHYTMNRRLHGFTQFSLFNLLDVSTAADLFGISIGFAEERFIFQETYRVEPVDATKSALTINGMDVMANSRFVRIYTVPQISWEPVLNITPPFNVNNDPPQGVLKFVDDGPPTLIGNTGNKPVALAPLPLTDYVVKNYSEDVSFKAWSLFTLPNGMISVGRYNQENFYRAKPNTLGATLSLVKASFANGTKTTLQLSTVAGENPTQNNRVFEGNTRQYFNVTDLSGTNTKSILGKTVTDIFNREFADNGIIVRGIPLERYDFTGYGANVFSSWLYNRARIAQVSQSVFDVWRGRVAKEVIQVRSLIYPWGIRVVRTITMYRGSTGFEYRVDSGWRADSDGVYDFDVRYAQYDVNGDPIKDASGNIVEIPDGNPYVFHYGLVQGVFNVKNIVENDLAPFKKTWKKTYGVHVDDNSGLEVPVPAGGVDLDVELIGVYFDADVAMYDVESGKVDGYVPSKKMLGYLQKAPRGVIISAEHFAELLQLQEGLGGPVDCLVNINDSGQKMRVTRVEVNPSRNEANELVFVVAAKGMPVLPKDGSWTLVEHNFTSKEVFAVGNNAVELIRKGKHTDSEETNKVFPKEITPAAELFKAAETRLRQYGFLQTTDTQKVLFRNPFFELGKKLLRSTEPDLADAYRLLNSKAIFPKLENLPKVLLDANNCAVKIIEKGFQLVDKLANEVTKSLEHDLPKGPWEFIKTKFIRVYVEYAKTGVKETDVFGPAKLQFDLNSEVNNWVNKMNDITMVVDMAGISRVFLIRGKFDTQKGKKPEFIAPELVPGEKLKPIVDILEVLASLAIEPDYKELVKKGLKIAMSNSPNNWEYKFQADKEIPVLRFPPKYLDGPTTPLRLEAFLKLGCYFNLPIPVPPSGLPAPSAGAFIEFGGRLSVMCVSLAAATIYAIGTINLRISADTVDGPKLYMKYAIGVELMVGLPVIGNVSVMYAVGIEISVDTGQITVAAMLIFRGRAELIGGLVTVTILIEASGKVQREFGSEATYCIAQVTFSLDISICFVIDINFTESWQESRQIA